MSKESFYCSTGGIPIHARTVGRWDSLGLDEGQMNESKKGHRARLVSLTLMDGPVEEERGVLKVLFNWLPSGWNAAREG